MIVRKNQTAVVTGAAGGLGVCFARRLAAEGYDLVLVDRRAEVLEPLAADLASQHGVAARARPTEMTDMDAMRSLAAELAGLGPIGILVNNAGFGLAKYFIDADVERHLDMLRVHNLAAVRLTHAVLPGMLQCNRGAIVNVASLCAWTPCAGVVSYSSTKAHLVAFSQAVQDEVRDTGIRIQALCPGFVYTGFHAADGMKTFDPRSIPRWMWLTSEQVVDCSLRNLRRRRVIVIPGRRMALLARFMQMPLFRPIVQALVRQERS